MRSVFHRMTDVYEAMDEAWDGIYPGTGCMTSLEVDKLMLDTPKNANNGKDDEEEEEEDVVQKRWEIHSSRDIHGYRDQRFASIGYQD